MKIFAGIALVAALAVTAAPGDVYFGKLKMSALRVRYEIVSIRDRYETHKILPEEAMHLAELTQDAFEDWAHRYPKDDWLASTGYNFAKLYEELPGTGARDRAIAMLTYVTSHFPATKYATQSRNDLHRGVAVRPDPAWAALRRASGTTSPSPAATALPSTTSPAPSASQPASSAPSPKPSGRRVPHRKA